MNTKLGIRETQRQAWLKDKKTRICLDTLLTDIEDSIDGSEDLTPREQQYHLWEQFDYLIKVLKTLGIDFDKVVTVDTYKPQIIPPEIAAGKTETYLNDVLED